MSLMDHDLKIPVQLSPFCYRSGSNIESKCNSLCFYDKWHRISIMKNKATEVVASPIQGFRVQTPPFTNFNVRLLASAMTDGPD